MNCTVDATAAKQSSVRRIDDRIERKCRDIGHTNFEPGSANFGGQEWLSDRHTSITVVIFV